MSALKVYLWTISFLKPYRGYVAMMILCGLFITTSELIIPKFIQYFIDKVLPAKDFKMFYYLLLVIGLILICLFGSRMVANMLQRIIRERAARDLQFSIFKHLRKLGFSYYERHPVGETLSFLNTEVAAIQDIYRVWLPILIQDILFVLVAFAILFSIHVKLTLVLLPCFLLYYLVGPYFEKKSSKFGKVVTQNRIQMNKQIYESISALPEFRAYTRETWDLERFMDKLLGFIKSQRKLVLYQFVRNVIRRLCNYIGAITIFIYSAYLIQHQQLTVGAFVAFVLLYFITMTKLTVVVSNLIEQRILMFQGEVLYKFMHEKPDVAESPNPVHISEIRGAITISNVHFKYPEGPSVMNGFDIHIQAGERIALVGTSGNGKSTLLKLISRFYDPDHGEILLDNVPLQQLSFKQLRGTIGYVFQETYLFGTTVRENIRFGDPDATNEQIEQAAKAAYAHDFIIGLTEGYDTLVGERGVKLSGGQKQRISIARLFLKNPKVILLDEATSALDNISEREVQRALDQLLENRTTITVAHRLSTIKDVDRILVIDQGQIVESGSYSQLMDARGIFYQLSEGELINEAS